MEDMSIQELVSVLRTAFMTEDFDRVEKVLVSKYNRLQTKIIDLQEKLELEKLTRFQAEEDCERHKNNYETLMKEVKKKTILTERDNTGELRKLKEKWMDDSNTLAEPPMKRSKDAQGASSSSSSGIKNLHFFLGYHNIGTKFSPQLVRTVAQSVGHTR
jgi:hypothetical protein